MDGTINPYIATAAVMVAGMLGEWGRRGRWGAGGGGQQIQGQHRCSVRVREHQGQAAAPRGRVVLDAC